MDKTNVRVQSEFDRKLYGEQKYEAYYTDTTHCNWISNMLDFKDGEEYCCLEPSIGNAKAIKSTIGKVNGDTKKIFGIEINPDTVKQLYEDSQLEAVIEADFLNGVKISHSSFSFCFSNPPYGVDEHKNRYERSFLEKLTDYLKPEAVLVYVIPASVFADESFLKCWCARFTTECVYRFHESEYAKFKQIVAIGYKKRSKGYFKEEYERILEKVKSPDNIPLLPEKYDGKKIIVNPSCASDIEYFSSKIFDEGRARARLSEIPILSKISHELEQEGYASLEVGKPPITPSNNMFFLLSVSGVGDGVVGSSENKDMHISRGSIKNIENSICEVDEITGKAVLRVRSSSMACYKTTQNNGEITCLT